MPDSPHPLKINVLGAPHVILPNGSSAVFEADAALALLIYLALNHKPMRRTLLASLLYPNQDDKQAMQNFRQTLFRLRRAIRDEEAAPLYLLRDSEGVQFNTASAHRLDAVEFDACIQATHQHRHRALHSCHPCMAQLAAAVNLYRGELLQGVAERTDAFGEWLRFERSRYRSGMTQALHALLAYHQLYQQADAVQIYCARLEQLEPLDEIALRATMERLARNGERNRALGLYRDFQARLRAELDVAPEAETALLAERIRKQQPLAAPVSLQHPNTLLTAQPRAELRLPNTLAPFTDRKDELAELSARLSGRDERLITLVGPSGSGKTRLAMRAAAADIPAWKDGVWLAVFEPERANEPAAQVIARALGIAVTRADRARVEVNSFLYARELLLVLDNVESSAETPDAIARLLENAPKLRIIATSLSRLGLGGETVLHLDGLGYPDALPDTQTDLEEWRARFPAVELFVAHAAQRQPDFALTGANAPAIARICLQVEGMPLALEMAAAWVRHLTCEEIADRLLHSLDLLVQPYSNAPTRQNSLRAAFEYALGRLSPAENDLVRRLARLGNSFTTRAAEERTGATLDQLAALCDKSLLRPSGCGVWSLYAVHYPFLKGT